MALVTPDTKLCEVIVDEPSVVPVINRFDIVLGVGDRTIKSICKEKGIDMTLSSDSSMIAFIFICNSRSLASDNSPSKTEF